MIEQLNELMANNYVERELDKGPRRGRPRHLYTATPLAQEKLFPPSRHLLPAMIQAINACGGDELRNDVFDKLGRVLAERYLPSLQGLSPKERLVALVERLRSEGMLADLETSSQGYTLRERSCPFSDLVNEDRVACEMERKLLSELIGWPVQLDECRLDGCASCVFRVTPDAADAPDLAADIPIEKLRDDRPGGLSSSPLGDRSSHDAQAEGETRALLGASVLSDDDEDDCEAALATAAGSSFGRSGR